MSMDYTKDNSLFDVDFVNNQLNNTKLRGTLQVEDEKSNWNAWDYFYNYAIKAPVVNLEHGINKAMEGIVDATLVFSGLFPNDDYKQWVVDTVKRDFTKEIPTPFEQMEGIFDYVLGGEFTPEAAAQQWEKVKGETQAVNESNGFTEWLSGIEESVGGMAFDAVVQRFTGTPSLVTLGVRSGGNAAEQAYQEGADYWGGFGYGGLRAGTEVGTEMLTGGLSKVYGKVNLLKFLNKLGIAGDILGEGFEEVVSDVLDPLEKTTYKGASALEEYKTGEFWQGLGESFLSGAATAGIVGGATGEFTKSNQLAKSAGESISNATASLQKMNRLYDNGKLTEQAEQKLLRSIQSDFEEASRAFMGMNEKARNKMFESNPNLYSVFAKNGSIRSDFATQTWGGRNQLSSTQKRYVSPNANVGQINNDLTSAHNKYGYEYKLYDGELSEAQAKNYDTVRHIFNNLNRQSGDNMGLVIISTDDTNGNAFTNFGANNIYVSATALETGNISDTLLGIEKRMMRLGIEEATHTTEKIRNAKEYKKLRTTVGNTKAYRSVINELTSPGNGYGFTKELYDSMNKRIETETESMMTDKESELMGEIVAHTTAEIMSGSKEMIDKYTRPENHALTEKVLSVLHKMKNALARLTSKEAREQYVLVKQVEKDLLDALKEKGYEYRAGKIVSAVLRDKEDEEKEKAAEAVDSEDGVRYSRETSNYDYSKSFSEQIDDFIYGKIPKTDTLIVGETPKIYQKIGFIPLPMTINKTHIDYALNGTKNADHSIGKSMLKQLPEALRNPIAIIVSKTSPKTSVVVLLEIQHNGNNIIAPIYINGEGRQNGIVIDSNAIKIVHSRKNAISGLLKNALQIEKDGGIGVFYWNKEKATSATTMQGVTMPEGLSLDDGFIHSIHEEGSPVKTKIKNIFETKQFKRWFGDSKVVNEDGTPKVLYHQTAHNFTVFNTDNPVAGLNDSETPNGIFLKENDHNIHIGGDIQMALYGKMEKPLRFANREEARAWYIKNIPGYSEANAEIEEIDQKYEPIYDKIDAEWDDYYQKHYDEFVKNDQDVLNNLDNIEKRMDALLEKWKEESNKARKKARAILNDYFLNGKSGYDGIILDYDGKRMGELVKSYIFFKNTQIKSATDNIGTFDSSNPDIRFSRSAQDSTDSAAQAEYNEDGTKLQTQGQRAKFVANNTTDRVYSRIESEAEINRIISEVLSKKYGRVTISGGRSALVEQYWTKLNQLARIPKKTKAETDAINKMALQIADFIIDHAMVKQAVLESIDDQKGITATEEQIEKHAKSIKSDLDIRDMLAEEIKKSVTTIGSASTFNKNTARKVRLALWNARLAKELVAKVEGKSQYVAADILNSPEMVAWIKTLKPLAGKALYSKDARRSIFELKKFYNENNELLNGYIDDNVLEAIDEIIQNGASDSYLSQDEMEALHTILSGMEKLYESYDKIELAGKRQSVTDVAIEGYKQLTELKDTKANKSWLEKAVAGMVEPRVVIEMMEGFHDNGVLSRMYEEILRGETKKKALYMQMMLDFDQFFKEHKKYQKRLAKTEIELQGHSLTIGQAITIYELFKRDQARAGLEHSGITFEDRKGNPVEINHITANDVSAIKDLFTEEDKEFIKVTERFFNEVASQIKEDADIKYLGYTNVLEGFYFPIARDKAAMQNAITDSRSALRAMVSLYGFSFNKDVKKGAKNAIRVDNVFDVIAHHADQLSTYAGMFGAMKTWDQIYNKNVAKELALSKTTTLQSYVLGHVWKGANDYLTKLMSDISNTTRVENNAFNDVFKYIRSSYATFQLGGNIKTFLAQISSYPEAFVDLDFDVLVKGFLKKSNHENMKKYSQYLAARYYEKAIVKAEGAIDTVGKVGDFMTKPIQFFDEVTIGKIWNACQLQVEKDSKGKLKFGTEENMQKAGELVEQVVRRTQPEFNSTERSAMMRSSNELVRALTMFSSAQIKQLSRFVESCGKLKYAKSTGNKAKIAEARAYFARTTAALVTSVVSYAMIGILAKALFHRLKAKDEPDDKKVLSVLKEFGFDVASAGIGLLPIVREIYNGIYYYFSQSKEFDMNTFYGTVVNDVANAVLKTGKLALDASSGKEIPQYQWNSAIKNVVNAIGEIAGIPTRNLYNQVTGIISWNTNANYAIKDTFYNTDYVKEINKAVENGEYDTAETIMNLMMSKRMDGTSTKKINQTLIDLHQKGYSVLPRTVSDSITYDGETYSLTKRQKTRFMQIYGKASSSVQKVISLQSYQKLSDEVKAKTIKRIYDMYYNLAIDDLLGTDTEDKTVLFSYAIDPDKLALIISQAQALEADKDKNGNTISGSKKQKVVNYINGLKITAAQKYMIMGYLGYRNAKGEEQVKAYINRLGALSKAEKKTLFEYSGYAA